MKMNRKRTEFFMSPSGVRLRPAEAVREPFWKCLLKRASGAH
jgi:hypothetical protein